MTDPINIPQDQVLALIGELVVENRILKSQLAQLQQKEATKNDEAHPEKP